MKTSEKVELFLKKGILFAKVHTAIDQFFPMTYYSKKRVYFASKSGRKLSGIFVAVNKAEN